MTIPTLSDLLADPPPSPSRIVDALTGGFRHLPADREVAQRLLAADPNMYWWAAAHLKFQIEAVIALARAGIRQWIHLGCGMPHVASAVTFLGDHPDLGGARLVCADDDPLVIAYLRRVPPQCHRNLRVTPLRATFDDPDQLMVDIASFDGVDLGEPVAILLTGVLHHVSDPAAADLLTTLRENVVTGSYLVLSHPCSPSPMTAPLTAAIAHYEHATGTTWTLRSPDTAPRLLRPGWTAQPPGITAVGRWHPIPPLDDEDDRDEHHPLAAVSGWAVLAAATPPVTTPRTAHRESMARFVQTLRPSAGRPNAVRPG